MMTIRNVEFANLYENKQNSSKSTECKNCYYNITKVLRIASLYI